MQGPARLPARAVAVAALVVAALGFGAQSASATHVRCGDLVTEDTTLDSDLTGCAGDGLRVGAHDVTIDLNGHTISAPPGPWNYGIRSENRSPFFSYKRLTIENGTIEGFITGIWLDGAAGSRVTNVRLFNGMGIDVGDARGVHVSHNRIVGGEIGLSAHNSAELAVAHNTFTGNSDTGISILGQSEKGPHVVTHNVVVGSTYGIYLANSRFTDITKNRIHDSHFGFFSFEDEDLLFSGNRILESASHGVFLRYPYGNVTLEGNASHRNGGDGFELNEDVFFSTPRNVIVTRNAANDNARLGIDADESITDGGGNKASGNGDPLQCLNVFCK